MSGPRWYQLPAEIVLVLFGGLLTYALCRAFYELSVEAAIVAGSSTMFVVALGIYYGRRLRAMRIESLPLEQQAAMAWRLVRRGLLGSLLGLGAVGFGSLAVYLVWSGSLLLGLAFVGAGFALGVTALVAIRQP